MVVEFFAIIIGVLAGVLVGVVTGLTPGLHANLVATLVVASKLPGELPVLAFLCSLAVSHVFHDAIPSIFLGVPSEGSVMAVLPGHKMVLQGRGYSAVSLLSCGGLVSLILSAVLVPLAFVVVPFLYAFVKPWTFWLVSVVCLYLVVRDQFPFRAFVILSLSGILGFFTLRSFTLSEPLLPLLTGLFGISSSLAALSTAVLPTQFNMGVRVPVLPVMKGSFLGMLSGFLPGIGSSQVASLSKTKSGEEFLVTIGALNASSIVMTLVTASVLGRARSGITAAVLQLSSVVTLSTLLILVLSVLLAGGISFFSVHFIARWVAIHINRLKPRRITIAIIVLNTIVVGLLSGVQGLGVLCIATSIGLLSIHFGCARSHAMGCIIVPVLVGLW